MSSSWGREIRPSAAARDHRTHPLRQGEDPGRDAGTGDAQVDGASGARRGLEMRVPEAKTRQDRGIALWREIKRVVANDAAIEARWQQVLGGLDRWAAVGKVLPSSSN